MTTAVRPGASRPLDPAQLRFVLVAPRTGGNVGSTARALKNLGFRSLVIVAPDGDPRDDEARRLAVDAADVLAGANLVRTLDAALAGAGTVVGLSARAGRHRRPHPRLDRFAPLAVDAAATAPVAFVFGREDRGLTDDELDRCTHLVHLPGDAAYPSFNLAQAVLLVAYEVRLAAAGAEPVPADEAPAGHAARESMYRHLERAWLAVGFIRGETREPIMRRFRRAIGRAALTDPEVALLRGVARQTLWAAGRAGLVEPEDDPPRDEPS